MWSDSIIKSEIPMFLAACINRNEHQSVRLITNRQTVTDSEQDTGRL